MAERQTDEGSSGSKGVARRLISCVVASISTTVKRSNVVPTVNRESSLIRGLEP